jgi:hypothetical protein
MKSLSNKLRRLVPLILIPLAISCEDKEIVRGVIDYEREVSLDNKEYKNFLVNILNKIKPVVVSYKINKLNKEKFSEFDSSNNAGDTINLIFYPNREFDRYELSLE